MAGETVSRNDHGNVDLLCFSVSSYRFCLPAIEVVSILPPRRLTRLPFSAADVAGVFYHAGEVVTCYDLRQKFSLPPRDADCPGQWLLGRDAGALLAFWVDRVSDIVERQHLEHQPLPMPTTAMTPFNGCYLDGERITLETSIERLHRCDAAAFHAAGLAFIQSIEGATAESDDDRVDASAEPTTNVGTAEGAGDDSDTPSVEGNPIACTGEIPMSADDTVTTVPVTGADDETTRQPASDTRAACDERLGEATVTDHGCVPGPDAAQPGQGPHDAGGVVAADADAGIPVDNASTDPTAARSEPPVAVTGRQPDSDQRQGQAVPTADASTGHDGDDAGILAAEHGRGVGNTVAALATVAADVAPAQSQAGQPGGESASMRAGNERQHDVATGAAIPLVAEEPLVPPGDRRNQRTDSMPPRRSVGGWAWGLVAILVVLTVAYPVFVNRKPVPPVTVDRPVDDGVVEDSGRGAATRDGDSTAIAETSSPAVATSSPSPVSGLQEVLRIEDDDLLIRVEREPEPEPSPASPTAAAGTSVEPTAEIRPAPRQHPADDAVTMTPAADTSAPRDTIEPGQFIRHRVVRGDTLWHIARHYLGDPFRYPQLARLSRIDNPDLIYPGDLVTIERRQSTD